MADFGKDATILVILGMIPLIPLTFVGCIGTDSFLALLHPMEGAWYPYGLMAK